MSTATTPTSSLIVSADEAIDALAALDECQGEFTERDDSYRRGARDTLRRFIDQRAGNGEAPFGACHRDSITKEQWAVLIDGLDYKTAQHVASWVAHGAAGWRIDGGVAFMRSDWTDVGRWRFVANGGIDEYRSLPIANAPTSPLPADLRARLVAPDEVFAVYGEVDGHRVMLPEYVGSKDSIRERVMQDAYREGFPGTFDQRLVALGWRVEPLHSSATAAIIGKLLKLSEDYRTRAVLRRRRRDPEQAKLLDSVADELLAVVGDDHA